MYKVSVDLSPEIEVKIENGISYVNGVQADFNVVANNDGTYHALYQGRSFEIEVLENGDHGLKFKMNGSKVSTKIKNDLEDLLHKMGMDKAFAHAMNEIKAPMPGLITKVLVQAGDVVFKGDNLLVMEAMKMENIIKAVGDGTVSEIKVSSGDKVDKNQLLIRF